MEGKFTTEALSTGVQEFRSSGASSGVQKVDEMIVLCEPQLRTPKGEFTTEAQRTRSSEWI
jgi:hypothetical protein